MVEQLTHFQTWTLFVTFQNDDHWFTKRTLLKQCCESSLMTLKLDTMDDEISRLTKDGYLSRRTADILTAGRDQMPDARDGEAGYRIDNKGILYVRQLHVALRDEIKFREMSPDLISQQDPALQEELGRNTLTLGTLISAGIQNIGPIITLILSLLH